MKEGKKLPSKGKLKLFSASSPILTLEEKKAFLSKLNCAIR